MYNTISFANYSYPKPHKLNCGDASFSGKFVFTNDEYIILFVSDGVSTCTNDYLASHEIVDFLIDYFKCTKETDINTCVKKAIREINQKLFEGVNGIKWLWATLTLLFYKMNSDEIFYFSFGDTRLYGFIDRKIKQISQDDITSRPYIENGRIKYYEGQPIMYKYVTKSIGFSEQLSIQINSMKIDKYSAFIIANDGFCDVENFEWIVSDVLNKEDMQNSLEQYERFIISQLADDASLAVIRIHEKTKFVEVGEKNIDQLKTLFLFERKSIIQNNLSSSIENKKEKEIGLILDLMFHEPMFTRTELIEILEKMIKNNISSTLIEKVKQLVWKGVIFYDDETGGIFSL